MIEFSHTTRLGIVGLVVLFLASIVPAVAGTISIQWDPVPDTDLAGYRVYYGTSPDTYDHSVDVGNVTVYTLGGLTDCVTWYVAVKAEDTEGLESVDCSNQVSGWPRPEVSVAVPDSGEQGQQLQVTVSGTNFMDGATVDFGDPDIVVHSVTVNSCSELVADVTIGSTAAVGARDVDVVNPDNVFGTGAGLFTVTDVTVAPSITSQPSNETVPVGCVATFRVSADGDPPLSYQWRKDGTDIPGATGDSHTTDPSDASDDGSLFTCVVTNPSGSVESDPATLTVTAAGTRVTSDLVALYTFEDGTGSSVRDVSGVGVPLDLDIEELTATTWTPYGLSLDAGTRVSSAAGAAKVIDAVRSSGEITVEAWIDPANSTQGGPAVVMTVSGSSNTRNATLGQASDAWDMALRSTSTDLDGRPTLTAPGGSVQGIQAHVVYTRDAGGNARLFVDGVERATTTVGGDLSNWSDGFRLALGNEFGADNPWIGEYQLVAIYDRALSAAEIDQNRAAGPDGDNPPSPNQPPVADFTADPVSGDAPLTVSFDASTSYDTDGSIVSYGWAFGDGGTGTGVTASHDYTSPGTYVAVLTVTDDRDATDTAQQTITVGQAAVPPSITSDPIDQIVDEGQTATFSVSADGTAPLSYQWQRNGLDIPGATQSSYTTPPTTVDDDGATFRCIVSNEAGSDTSNPATLTVRDVTAPSVQATDPADGRVATIVPAATLGESQTYRIQAVGGSGGVTDVAGNPMASTYTQTNGFTIANQPPGTVGNVQRDDTR
jgi:PKD repeat protein